MQRRLVKQGRNALTTTLPASWIKKRGLQAGDAIEVEEEKDRLVISTTKRQKKSITVNVRGEEKSTYWHIITAAYIEGYDEITVLHDNTCRINEISRNLFGMIIESHSEKTTLLRNIAAVPEEQTDALMRRAGHQFGQMALTLEKISRGEATYQQIKEEEQILDNTLLYVWRHCNKHEKQSLASHYTVLCAWIEMTADMLSIIAKHIGKDKELASAIRKGIEAYVEGLFSKDYSKLYTKLRAFKEGLDRNTFAQGATYAMADMLYNNIALFVHTTERQNI